MTIKNFEKQTILAKVEVTQGVDAVPTPLADAMEVFDFAATPESDSVTRSPNRSTFANDQVSYPNKRWNISFGVEITGSGAVDSAPAIDPILLMCALSGTQNVGTNYTYVPNSNSTTTGTIYFYLDGILMKALGARGTIDITPAIGDVTRGSVTMIADYVKPVDQAVGGVPDFSAFRQPVLNTEANSELSIHGTLVHGEDFALNMNNTNTPRESTETKFIAYTDRQVSANLNCWVEDIAEFDPCALWESEAGGVVYWQTGTVPGDRVRITMPNAQIGAPPVSDSSGIARYGITVIPHPTPTGEDDEFALIFS